MEKKKHGADPRGLIFEAYRLEDPTAADCRTIFLDWALGLPEDEDLRMLLIELRSLYGEDFPDHPMTAVIDEGLAEGQRPRGGRGRFSARRGRGRN